MLITSGDWPDMGDRAFALPEQLPLVSFHREGYRFAVEASRVLAKQASTSGGVGAACLVIQPPEAESLVLEVKEPIALISLPIAQIHPVPPFIEGQCTLAGLRALAFDGQGILFVLEPW